MEALDLLHEMSSKNCSLNDINEEKNKNHQLVTNSLKAFYKKELEYIGNTWEKFGVGVNNLYNKNIIISDKYKELQATFENTEQLFATDRKRILIVAEAGYGKSAFLYEMIRQWVKGENPWTKKFSFLFLFSMAELKQQDTRSLQNLLATCFGTNESTLSTKLLEDADVMKSCLFIFDGLDELQHVLCEEIQIVIDGTDPKTKQATVIITSRPCALFYEVEQTQCINNLVIELNGYTEKGIHEQTQDYGVVLENVPDNLMDTLKVPLLNKILCLTHKEFPIKCWNLCNTIEMFVKFACKRFVKLNENSLKTDEHGLIMVLGQASQNKYSFMEDSDIHYPVISQETLTVAIDIGLLSKKSTTENLFFFHRTFAEYCAAYFWSNHSPLKIRIMEDRQVDFVVPERCSLADYGSLFSCFLSHFNAEYKNFLWENFAYRVPYLDEYESLLCHQVDQNINIITLECVPTFYKSTVLEKIEFLKDKDDIKNCYYYVQCAQFDDQKSFESIIKMNSVYLVNCSLNLNQQSLQHFLKLRSLEMDQCSFNIKKNTAEEDLNELSTYDCVLEELAIFLSDFSLVNFLSFIMKDCLTLKIFKLQWSLEPYMKVGTSLENETGANFGHGWLHKLRNNEKLLNSIEEVELWSHKPDDLSIFFEILGKMPNLKTLEIVIDQRNLSKSEQNALVSSFRTGCKQLKNTELSLNDENGKRLEFIILS